MVIADTGYWLALADRRDLHHSRAKAWTDAHAGRLVTTVPVLTETCHLLLTRLGASAQARLVAAVERGVCDLFSLDRTRLQGASALMRKYADLPMDLADASLVLLAEHLGHGRIVSTDARDFRTYRWKARRPFQNLLFP